MTRWLVKEREREETIYKREKIWDREERVVSEIERKGERSNMTIDKRERCEWRRGLLYCGVEWREGIHFTDY